MPPWIQVYSNILTHDKTYALADRLKIPNYGAAGLMVSLWCWAAVNAPDGDITSYPPRAIAEASGWTKKPDVYYNILLDIGILQKHEDAVHIINAQQDAQQKNEKKNKSNERVKRYRERQKDVTGCNADCNAHVTQDVTGCNADCNAHVTQDVTDCNADCNAHVTQDVTDCNADCNAHVTQDVTDCNADREKEEEEKQKEKERSKEKERKKEEEKKERYIAPAAQKKTFGEFEKVKLADMEYLRLVQRLGKDSTEDYITRLDGWLAEGHVKKNHYATILNWWRKDNGSVRQGARYTAAQYTPERGFEF